MVNQDHNLISTIETKLNNLKKKETLALLSVKHIKRIKGKNKSIKKTLLFLFDLR
ncbi:hypothetical protein EW15_1730 [Prochlorococcus sp. MIT 0801]|nr:hypothetical protein EW15_1730 [Prochlorococcus sp. MIT 0801]